MDIQSAATAFAAAATLFGIIIMIGTFFPARCVSEAIIDKREQRVRGLGGSVDADTVIGLSREIGMFEA